MKSKSQTNNSINNFDNENLQTNEKFFENCIDLIPVRIYLNADDRKQWFSLLNKEIDNDADDENDDIEDDEIDENQIKHSRFDPIYYKTVSQLYKELEKCKKLNKPINFQNVKKVNHQKVRKNNENDDDEDDEGELNEERKKKIKLENKNQSSGSGDANKTKSKDKKLSKKQQEKKEKRKLENNLELTQSSGDDTNSKANKIIKTQKPILNQNGQIVYSKFDFSVDGGNSNNLKSKNNKKHSKLSNSNVKPKDYKVLVKKLQEKKEKLTKLKEIEPEKAFELETKEKWKTVLDRASGVKVKDDIDLLKKSIKRVEKKKEKSKKEWTDRKQKIEYIKQKAQEKRQKNIDMRKEKKREKKVKRLKKKGRLLPGF